MSACGRRTGGKCSQIQVVEYLEKIALENNVGALVGTVVHVVRIAAAPLCVPAPAMRSRSVGLLRCRAQPARPDALRPTACHLAYASHHAVGLPARMP